MSDYLRRKIQEENKPLTDKSIIWFGEHQGKQLSQIPDSYFLWLYENGKAFGKIAKYIEDNLESIKQNANATRS